MKKIMILSFALVAALFALNRVAAQAGTGTLQMEVVAGTLTCAYDESLTILQTGAASFSSSSIEGTFLSPFVCTDLKGTDPDWNLAVETSTLTNVSNSNYTIANTNVEFKTVASSVTDGACAILSGTTAYAAIDTAKTIMGKNNDLGAICEITATDPMIKVTIPAYNAVGVYTSTLTYTLTT